MCQAWRGLLRVRGAARRYRREAAIRKVHASVDVKTSGACACRAGAAAGSPRQAVSPTLVRDQPAVAARERGRDASARIRICDARDCFPRRGSSPLTALSTSQGLWLIARKERVGMAAIAGDDGQFAAPALGIDRSAQPRRKIGVSSGGLRAQMVRRAERTRWTYFRSEDAPIRLVGSERRPMTLRLSRVPFIPRPESEAFWPGLRAPHRKVPPRIGCLRVGSPVSFRAQSVPAAFRKRPGSGAPRSFTSVGNVSIAPRSFANRGASPFVADRALDGNDQRARWSGSDWER